MTVSLKGYVKTLEISDITTSSATCKGNVQIILENNVPCSYNGNYIEEIGICYAKITNPTVGDYKIKGKRRTGNVVVLNPKTGEYFADLENLPTNTTFYVRAYAITTVGIFYGNELCFDTN